MFKRKVGDLNHERIRREPVGFDNDRPGFFFCLVEERPQLFDGDFSVPEINRGRGAASDADNLGIDLGTEGEVGERNGNRDAWLKNEVRAEKQKEDQEKGDVEERDRREPAEMMFFRSGKLHALPRRGRLPSARRALPAEPGT